MPDEYLCLTCSSRFPQKTHGFTINRAVGGRDSSFSCEHTERKPELQVETQISCNAANTVNSQS